MKKNFIFREYHGGGYSLKSKHEIWGSHASANVDCGLLGWDTIWWLQLCQRDILPISPPHRPDQEISMCFWISESAHTFDMGCNQVVKTWISCGSCWGVLYASYNIVASIWYGSCKLHHLRAYNSVSLAGCVLCYLGLLTLHEMFPATLVVMELLDLKLCWPAVEITGHPTWCMAPMLHWSNGVKKQCELWYSNVQTLRRERSVPVHNLGGQLSEWDIWFITVMKCE
jgi:hypothetical protein